MDISVQPFIFIDFREFNNSSSPLTLSKPNFNFLSQKLKTRVVKQNVNPEWNEELTFSVDDTNLPVKIVSI